MPQPSVFLQTGHGLAAIWLIEPIPVSALRHWQGAMGALIDLTIAFRADKACKDATRVFRISGTLNEKSHKEVRVSGGSAERYRFDTLADQIFRAAGRPTRAELQARKKRVTKKRRVNATMPRGLTQAEQFRLIRDDLADFLDAHGGFIPTGLLPQGSSRQLTLDLLQKLSERCGLRDIDDERIDLLGNQIRRFANAYREGLGDRALETDIETDEVSDTKVSDLINLA